MLWQLEQFSTLENIGWLGNMLGIQQNMDVQVSIGGVRPVANQERPIPTIKNLNPDPGELLYWGDHLYLKSLLSRRRC